MTRNSLCNDYIDYPDKYMLLFEIMLSNNILLMISIFTNESSIDCSDDIEHKCFAW